MVPAGDGGGGSGNCNYVIDTDTTVVLVAGPLCNGCNFTSV